MRRKPHRLDRKKYVGRIFVAFTACEERRVKGFCEPTLHAAFHSALERSASLFDCKVPFYCVMPDHLHVLVQGMSDRSDTLAVIEKFKNLSGRWLYRHRPGLGWQEGEYDHIVREAEGWRAQAKYFACNPIRAGFVDVPSEWPYFGSVGYTLDEVMKDIWM